ncbi:MAG: ABC transporter ATP-binding protein [Anaerolineales bacterium]|nr:ABC transporter ATP-binding protein [Anaerolineales bacterium]
MTRVSLSNLTKQFPNAVTAVNGLTLGIPDGKITALLGPSGCGKTTILKMIAGIIQPTSGDILFDGHSILGQPAEKRGAVMVFQNHLLFPYLTVEENVAFGLKMHRESPTAIRRKVADMLDLMQLTGYERQKPNQLSGGQQQRVALARALVVEPMVLLLDEPFSNLDANLRDEMRELTRQLQRQKGIPTVFVTHDQEEAVVMADQLALILKGVLQQVDEPRAFYEKPANLPTAVFFGANNILSGAATGTKVQTGIGEFRLKNQPPLSGPVNLVIRPENIRIDQEYRHMENCISGCIQSCLFSGTHTRLKIKVGETVLELATEATAQDVFPEGEKIRVYLPPEKLWGFQSQ